MGLRGMGKRCVVVSILCVGRVGLGVGGHLASGHGERDVCSVDVWGVVIGVRGVGL